MAYELKPGQGTIFKNSKKEKENQPEYKGEIMTPSGEKLEIALWVKEGQKGKFFSAAIKPPYVKDENATVANNATTEDDGSGLPF
jgi:hypothetical protein